MPLYEYGCPRCRQRFERLRPLARADEPAPCPGCGAGAQRLIALVAPTPRGNGAEAAVSAGGCACGGACACGR